MFTNWNNYTWIELHLPPPFLCDLQFLFVVHKSPLLSPALVITYLKGTFFLCSVLILSLSWHQPTFLVNGTFQVQHFLRLVKSCTVHTACERDKRKQNKESGIPMKTLSFYGYCVEPSSLCECKQISELEAWPLFLFLKNRLRQNLLVCSPAHSNRQVPNLGAVRADVELN